MLLKYKQFKNNFLRKIISKLSARLDYFEQCSTLPKITYTPEISECEQEKYYLKYLNPNLKNYPGIVCPYLHTLLKVLYHNKKFNLLDYGARNLDNFAFLNSMMPGLQYYYRDLPEYNVIIEKFRNKHVIDNLYVINDDENIKDIAIDFVFMGSVLQYLENYKETLKFIFDSNPKYIFLSGQNCYENQISTAEYIIYRQLNVLPQINYGLFFHFESLKKFFKSHGWNLETVSKTNFDSLRNFKGIDKKVGFINNLDLLFKRLD